MATCHFSAFIARTEVVVFLERCQFFCAAQLRGWHLPSMKQKTEPLQCLMDSSGLSRHIQIQTVELKRNCASTSQCHHIFFSFKLCENIQGIKKEKKIARISHGIDRGNDSFVEACSQTLKGSKGKRRLPAGWHSHECGLHLHHAHLHSLCWLITWHHPLSATRQSPFIHMDNCIQIVSRKKHLHGLAALRGKTFIYCLTAEELTSSMKPVLFLFSYFSNVLALATFPLISAFAAT